MRALKSVLFPIHPEGFRFIAILPFWHCCCFSFQTYWDGSGLF